VSGPVCRAGLAHKCYTVKNTPAHRRRSQEGVFMRGAVGRRASALRPVQCVDCLYRRCSMSRFVDSRVVLAVRDLSMSTQFYTDVLGFRRDPVDAKGWSFLSRDAFKLMLGECADEVPASEV